MFHSVEITLLYEADQAGARKMKFILSFSCLIHKTIRSSIINGLKIVLTYDFGFSRSFSSGN